MLSWKYKDTYELQKFNLWRLGWIGIWGEADLRSVLAINAPRRPRVRCVGRFLF